jgi:hypothetical protein
VQVHRAFDLVKALWRRQFRRAVDERCDARGDGMGRESGRVACQAVLSAWTFDDHASLLVRELTDLNPPP